MSPDLSDSDSLGDESSGASLRFLLSAAGLPPRLSEERMVRGSLPGPPS